MDSNLSKLTHVLVTLAELTAWAQDRLDDETHDRQHIAEHVTAQMHDIVQRTVPQIFHF